MNQQSDGQDLVCPECSEPAATAQPSAWTPAWGPAPAYSHLDGEPLCPVVGPHGYRPADPAARSTGLDQPTGTGLTAEAITEPVAEAQEFGL